MARQYFRKKDPTAPIPEWIEMSGQEFYRFTRSPEGRGRCFIDFDDYVIEASRDQYEEWRKEKDHSDYLREQEEKLLFLSLYSGAIDEYGNGEDVIADERVNVEESTFLADQARTLGSMLQKLDSPSYWLIHELYLAEERKTERALAEELGVSQNAVHKRKKKILKKLKTLVVKSEKSSQ